MTQVQSIPGGVRVFRAPFATTTVDIELTDDIRFELALDSEGQMLATGDFGDGPVDCGTYPIPLVGAHVRFPFADGDVFTCEIV